MDMTIWKIGKVIPLLSKCMNKGSTGTVIVMPFCPIQCVQLMIGITTMAFVERTIRQESINENLCFRNAMKHTNK